MRDLPVDDDDFVGAASLGVGKFEGDFAGAIVVFDVLAGAQQSDLLWFFDVG